MNPNPVSSRGQPLLALGLLAIGWTLARAALWEAPFALAGDSGIVRFAGNEEFGAGGPMGRSPSETGGAEIVGQLPSRPVETQGVERSRPLATALRRHYRAQASLPGEIRTATASIGSGALAPATSRPDPAGRVSTDARPFAVPPLAQPEARRWSLATWALWREGSRQAAGTALPRYGATQVGAVLRYSLARQSAAQPDLFARATHAPVAGGENEVAIGASVRPVPAIPLRAHAELRGTSRPAGEELRPAAFVVTELPEAKLPLGLTARAYAQAGYVGGQFATGFVDGTITVDHTLTSLKLGDTKIVPRLGAGAWGGAQQGAARLDVGPSASLSLEGGPAPVRIGIDYRLRIAGDAEPGDGIAITVATGF